MRGGEVRPSFESSRNPSELASVYGYRITNRDQADMQSDKRRSCLPLESKFSESSHRSKSDFIFGQSALIRERVGSECPA